MSGWKLCVQCGEPTLLTLYCDQCFRANFVKPVRKLKYSIAARASLAADLEEMLKIIGRMGLPPKNRG